MIGTFLSSESGLSSGGTISGDVTISGDLTVTGAGGGFAYTEVITGDVQINGPEGTGATSAGVLVLSTAEETVRVGSVDQLGRIDFQAPSETGGSDAILVGASIHAVAAEDFSATNNSTALVFSTGTTTVPIERMRIDQDGLATFTGSIKAGGTSKVYFNTTSTGVGSSTVNELDIFSYGEMTISTGASNANILLTPHGTGKVGIGNTAPGSDLEISKSGQPVLEISSWSTTESHSPQLTFQKSGSATVNTLVATEDDEDLGVINWYGVNNAGTPAATKAASILVEQNEAKDTDSVQARMIFSTSDSNDAGSPTERMRIDSYGQVGIGGTPSSAKLHLYTASSSVALKVERGDGSLGLISAGSSTTFFGTGDATDVEIGVNSSVKMKIDANSRISLGNNDLGDYNTLFGRIAGGGIVSGMAGNVAIGYDAFKRIGHSSADYNVIIGNLAMGAGHNTAASNTANNNVFIGYTSGGGTTAVDVALTAANNVGIGSSALTVISSGANNVAVGSGAGVALTTASGNAMLGYYAGSGNVTNGGCVFIGDEAGRYTDGGGNVGIGEHAFKSSGTATDNTGAWNVAIGHSALTAITDGDNNVALGTSAGAVTTVEDDNVFIGKDSASLMYGASNVAVGKDALKGATFTQATCTYDDDPTVTHPDNANIIVGLGVKGTGIPDGSYITAVATVGGGTDTFELNASTTGGAQGDDGGSANQTLTFYSRTEKSVAIGMDALTAATTSDSSVAIGHKALTAVTVGDRNVAAGYQAGQALTTGGSNVMIGQSAGGGSTDVDGAVIIGANAGIADMTDAADNTVAIGNSALRALTTGAGNTAAGYNAGLATVAGSYNTVVGLNSLLKSGSSLGGDNSSYNTVMGQLAMGGGHDTVTANTANKNVAIGNSALGGSTGTSTAITAHSNVVIGFASGLIMSSANNDVFIGRSSGDAVTTGSNNTGVGSGSLGDLNTGSNNTVIGVGAGGATTDGGNNTCIGYGANTNGGGSHYQIAIGSGATGVSDYGAVIGAASITDVYMAQDSGAIVHSGALVNGLSAILLTTGTLAYATHSIVRGKYVTVSAHNQTLTLPGVVVGAVFIIVNIAADGGALLTIVPDGADRFLLDIAGAVGTEGNNISNTQATQNQGDFVKLVGMSGDGWAITEIGGIWADE